ncbi:MAG: hypothetical protein C0598_13885 [Marinilabiliales bacterium]|nr:MAG: hypothetical protein C0598_13885 [Marinilabiliales bacterium]
MEEFVIPFKGLDVGNHLFKFKIGDKLFESFEYFENINGELDIEIDLLKEPNMMIFDFSFKGKLKLQCDRCLGKYDQNINGKNQLIVKYGDKFMEESEEVIIIPVNESRIDVKQYIFEYVGLLIPVWKIHPDDENGEAACDNDITDRIDQYSKPDNDPRWDALKDLKID